MKVKAIKIKQYNMPFLTEGGSKHHIEKVETIIYITAMPMEWLADINKVTIDRRTTDHVDGYQRELNENRIRKELLSFLSGEIGAYPTSVLLNVREKEKIQFKPEINIGEMEIGELEISDDVQFYIVDGQHRIESLRMGLNVVSHHTDWASQLKNYILPVNILVCDREFEMGYFYIINDRQKGVPLELAADILYKLVYKGEFNIPIKIKPGQRILAKAVEITRILNEDGGSPWKGCMADTNEKYDPYTHIIRASVFWNSISKYILKDKVFDKIIPQDVANLLIEYWQAIKEIYPEAFNNKYYLVLNSGIGAFHILFNSLYISGKKDKNGFKEAISHLKEETPEHPNPAFKAPISSDIWHKSKAPSIFSSGDLRMVACLAEALREKIEIRQKKKIRLKASFSEL